MGPISNVKTETGIIIRAARSSRSVTGSAWNARRFDEQTTARQAAQRDSYGGKTAVLIIMVAVSSSYEEISQFLANTARTDIKLNS